VTDGERRLVSAARGEPGNGPWVTGRSELLVALLALALLSRTLEELLAALLLWLLALLLWLLALLLGFPTLLIVALLLSREEPTGLRVTRPLLGQVVHPLAELLGMALVLGALAPWTTLLPWKFGLLAERLLLPGGLTLLALGLLLDGLWPGLLRLGLLVLRLL